MPLDNPGAPGGSGSADVSYNLAITFNGTAFAINDATYIEEVSLPVLLQILSGTTSAQDLLPEGSVYTLPRNSTVEISIPGGAVGSPVSNLLNAHKICTKYYYSILSIFTGWVVSGLIPFLA